MTLDAIGLTTAEPTLEDWTQAGHLLASGHSQIHWTIGDWVTFGAEHWEDRWLGIASRIGIPHATIAQAAGVAAAFPHQNRHDALSWTHHRIAMGEPDPHSWLDRAEEGGWSARELTEQIRASRELNAAQDELPAMPPKPLFDRGLAARLLADGVTRVIVDLTTGNVEPCDN